MHPVGGSPVLCGGRAVATGSTSSSDAVSAEVEWEQRVCLSLAA
jgi:hypothetical protein